MENVSSMEALEKIRGVKREEIDNLRNAERHELHQQKRISFKMKENHSSDTSLEKFQELILVVKKRKANLEVLRTIKRNCCIASHSSMVLKTDGALSALIGYVLGRDSLLQLESLCVLTNLVCGSHKAANRVARTAGPHLIALLNSASPFLQDQSAWALGNIANDCEKCCSVLKAQGVLAPLLQTVQSSNPDVVRSSAFALNAVTRHADTDSRMLLNAEITDTLLRIVADQSQNTNTRQDAAFTLSNIFHLAILNKSDIGSVTGGPFIDKLLSLFSEDLDISISIAVTRCLGYLTLYDEVCRYLCTNTSFENTLLAVLNSSYFSLKAEFLWLLTNIAVCEFSNVGPLEISLTLQVIDTNWNESVSIQALYYLCTLAAKSETLRHRLNSDDVISRVQSLTCDQAVIDSAVQTFMNIVSKGAI